MVLLFCREAGVISSSLSRRGSPLAHSRKGHRVAPEDKYAENGRGEICSRGGVRSCACLSNSININGDGVFAAVNMVITRWCDGSYPNWDGDCTGDGFWVPGIITSGHWRSIQASNWVWYTQRRHWRQLFGHINDPELHPKSVGCLMVDYLLK